MARVGWKRWRKSKKVEVKVFVSRTIFSSKYYKLGHSESEAALPINNQEFPGTSSNEIDDKFLDVDPYEIGEGSGGEQENEHLEEGQIKGGSPMEIEKYPGISSYKIVDKLLDVESNDSEGDFTQI